MKERVSANAAYIILLMITLTAHWHSLSGGFCYDDMLNVRLNDEIKSFNNVSKIILDARGVRTLSLMLDYALFGDNPFGYHIQNLLWHILSVFLVYALFRRLFPSKPPALLAAIIFALHPIHVEAVASITNRKEMLSLSFTLISMLCYLKALDNEFLKRYVWLTIGVAAFFLAIKSKAVAIALPFIIACYEAFFLTFSRRLLLSRKYIYIKAASLISFFIYIIYFYRGALFYKSGYYYHYNGIGEQAAVIYKIINNIFAIFPQYLLKIILPFGLLPDYSIEARDNLFNASLIISLTFFAFYLYTIAITFKKERLVSFGLCWFLLSYAVISQINLAAYPMADRYMYAPSVGVSLIAGVLLDKLSNKLRFRPLGRNLFYPAVGLIFTTFFILTFRQVGLWKNNETLWSYTAKKNPYSQVAQLQLAQIYIENYRLEEAAKQLKRIGELHPFHPRFLEVNCLSGMISYRKGDTEGAVALYRKALAYNTGQIIDGCRREFADILFAERRDSEALKEYRKLPEGSEFVKQRIEKLEKRLEYRKKDEISSLKDKIEKSPGDAALYLNLGIIYYMDGLYDKAEPYYLEALRLSGERFEVIYNLGLLYMKMGENKKSSELFEKAVSFKMAMPELHDNLGMVYANMGEKEKAVEQFRTAIKVNKEFASSYLHLADMYLASGEKSEAIQTYRDFLQRWSGDEHYRDKVVYALKYLEG